MNLLASAAKQTWLMEPTHLRQYHERLPGMVATHGWPTAAQLEAHREAAAAAMRKVSGKVAVVPVYGVIEQRGSEYSYFYGGTSTDVLGQTLDRLAASREVEAVILDFESPGGSVGGVEELGDQLYSLRASKAVYALSNSLCASAAYWLASQCTQVISTPGGDTGSIGVFAVHADVSKALEAAGVTVTIVKAGRYKAEANPYQELDTEARDYLQEQVDETYTKFCAAVARGRGVKAADVKGAKFGQGRCMSADAALANGLIDKIMTMNQLLERLGGSPVDGRAATRAQVMRMRHKWEKEKSATAQ